MIKLIHKSLYIVYKISPSLSEKGLSRSLEELIVNMLLVFVTMSVFYPLGTFI